MTLTVHLYSHCALTCWYISYVFTESNVCGESASVAYFLCDIILFLFIFLETIITMGRFISLKFFFFFSIFISAFLNLFSSSSF